MRLGLLSPLLWSSCSFSQNIGNLIFPFLGIFSQSYFNTQEQFPNGHLIFRISQRLWILRQRRQRPRVFWWRGLRCQWGIRLRRKDQERHWWRWWWRQRGQWIRRGRGWRGCVWAEMAAIPDQHHCAASPGHHPDRGGGQEHHEAPRGHHVRGERGGGRGIPGILPPSGQPRPPACPVSHSVSWARVWPFLATLLDASSSKLWLLFVKLV